MPHKPLKEMTIEERRAYNADKSLRALNRKRQGIVLRPQRERPLTSLAVGVLLDSGYPPETLGKKNISLEIGLAQRMKNTVAGLSGPPLYMDETDFINSAIRIYNEVLEEQHNDGKPFPQVPVKGRVHAKVTKMKRGRPRKAK